MVARLPLKIGSNDAAGDDVTHWQRWGKEWAKAYADLMGPVDGYYGMSDAEFTREMQRRLGLAPTGVFDEELARRVGYLGRPTAPAKPTLYTTAGTWSHWDAGFQADVARALLDVYDWQPVWYPASFGFINPPYPNAPAYCVSVDMGVDENVRLINLKPGKVALGGYSQGAEVVGRLCQEFTDGRLRHRRADLIGVVTFGDPARQKHDTVMGTGTEGWGISRLKIDPSISRLTMSMKGDMYSTTPDTQAGDQMHAVYLALTRMGDRKVNGHPALLAELVKIATNPMSGGMAVVDAVIRAAQVSAHGNYGHLVPAAVEHLRAAARR